MARHVFYSFHYDDDCFRVSQVRNIGMVEGNRAAYDNEWESVRRGDDAAIARWIDGQLVGRTCTVVLIGQATARRKWIDYEIGKSWNRGMGVVGVHIHNLKDRWQLTAPKGANPFAHFTMDRETTRTLDTLVRCYDPPCWDSRDVYAHISSNLGAWVDEAIAIRNRWGN